MRSLSPKRFLFVSILTQWQLCLLPSSIFLKVDGAVMVLGLQGYNLVYFENIIHTTLPFIFLISFPLSPLHILCKGRTVLLQSKKKARRGFLVFCFLFSSQQPETGLVDG